MTDGVTGGLPPAVRAFDALAGAFDERFGAARVREALLRGEDPDSVLDRELPATIAFRESIKAYLLYR